MSGSAFEQELQRRLEAIRGAALHRELRRIDSISGPCIEWGGRALLSFASNDYLGLADHPALKEAAREATARFGTGSRASRLICGSLATHHDLEDALAEFQQTEAALAFSSGYAAALGVVPALVGPGDVVAVDQRIHACLVDAARLSRARLRVFRHNDLNSLESILKWADGCRAARAGTVVDRRPRVLVVTESVYSMDGDTAPLPGIVELKDRHGAWLLVDEAHATGLLGPAGRGLIEEHGLHERVEVHLGTLGKALGASGGFICGSHRLVEYLVNQARTLMFSTAPMPAASAAALAALGIVPSHEGAQRRAALWARVEEARKRLEAWLPPVGKYGSAILPVILGEERRTLEVAAALRGRDVFVPAIRYPTVARGSARLRISLTAAHSPMQVETLVRGLSEVLDPAALGTLS